MLLNRLKKVRGWELRRQNLQFTAQALAILRGFNDYALEPEMQCLLRFGADIVRLDGFRPRNLRDADVRSRGISTYRR